jgi:transcriptional regulator with XRE-family HTH domain
VRGTGRASLASKEARSLEDVEARKDIREFLTSRRAKITPEEAGLPAYGHNRRVKGLRREEAAMLAGISVEYYIRLERGNAAGVSADVLEGVARALHLDEAERAHLFDLVSAANATFRLPRRRPTQERVRPTVQRILESITAPAYVRNSRLDLLAANALGHALYAPVFEDTIGTPNMSRFIFLNPRASEFFHDWESIANDAVAILRA